MDNLGEVFKQIGFARLAAIVGVTGGVAAVLAAVMLRIGDPPMTLLFSDLEYSDAQAVIERLEQANIPYQLRGGGTAILAPQDQVASLRLSLSAEGLPANGVVGYEIFDENDGFGVTSFQQNLNRLRALEGELARTIQSLQSIRSARVHLVIPERELFSRERKTPKASIVVETTRGGITPTTARAIQNLVSAAVPDLEPTGVTILDNRGNLLARATAGEEDDEYFAATLLEERTAATEARIRNMVEDIVASVVGPDNVRVQVSAEIDFSRITESREIFDPDGQVVLSTRTVQETSSDSESERDESVTIGNALPEAEVDAEADPSQQSQSSRSRTEEQVNYEISKTLRNEIMETGGIERLSVAVAVDGDYVADDSGAEQYVARTEEEMERIQALVRSAIGFDSARGDQVEVVNIRFARPAMPETAPEKAPLLGLTKDDYMRIAELAVLGLIGLLLIFFVLRPFLSERKSKDADTGDAPLPIASGPAPAQLAGPGQEGEEGEAASTALLVAPESSELEQQIDIAQIQGQVKASSVRKIAEIVKEQPEESVAILRNWLHEA